jgi:hypothetical protein
LDHFVGGGQQRFRDDEAKRLGCVEVDYELVIGRQHHRQIGRLRTLDDSAGILTNLTIRPRDVGAITLLLSLRLCRSE